MKKYRLIVYNEKFGFSNYDDNVYLSGKHDNIKDTALLKETNSFPALMRMWNRYLKEYEGYTYCIKTDENEFLIGGVYDPSDYYAIKENYKY